MDDDHFRYDAMVEAALRGVVKQAVSRVAEEGLRGRHHFYITFRTQAPGVVVPDHLAGKYPDEMTIVLQHQFWGLEVTEHAFQITLSFSNRSERLTVPFSAITAFADPSVKFGLQFQVEGRPAEDNGVNAGENAAPSEETEAEPGERKTAEVVTLDRFRKK